MMKNAPGSTGSLVEFFWYAQNDLPNFNPPDLKADQLHTLQQAISSAKSSTRQTLHSDSWKVFERKLSPEQLARK